MASIICWRSAVMSTSQAVGGTAEGRAGVRTGGHCGRGGQRLPSGEPGTAQASRSIRTRASRTPPLPRSGFVQSEILGRPKRPRSRLNRLSADLPKKFFTQRQLEQGSLRLPKAVTRSAVEIE